MSATMHSRHRSIQICFPVDSLEYCVGLLSQFPIRISRGWLSRLQFTLSATPISRLQAGQRTANNLASAADSSFCISQPQNMLRDKTWEGPKLCCEISSKHEHCSFPCHKAIRVGGKSLSLIKQDAVGRLMVQWNNAGFHKKGPK